MSELREPWTWQYEIGGGETTRRAILKDADGRYIATCVSPAYARRIIEAVNTRGALRAENKRLREALKDTRQGLDFNVSETARLMNIIRYTVGSGMLDRARETIQAADEFRARTALEESGMSELNESPCPVCGKVPEPGEWHNNTFTYIDGTSLGPICGIPGSDVNTRPAPDSSAEDEAREIYIQLPCIPDDEGTAIIAAALAAREAPLLELLHDVLMDIAARPDIQNLMGFTERKTYERARTFLNERTALSAREEGKESPKVRKV